MTDFWLLSVSVGGFGCGSSNLGRCGGTGSAQSGSTARVNVALYQERIRWLDARLPLAI